MAIFVIRRRLALLAVTAAAATAASPTLFFTHNLPPPAEPHAVTSLEQGLLVRIDAAQVSIDAVLYEFDRASVRDALLAAHARGVRVRVVTDDATRSGGEDGPVYAALAAAGIAVRDDAVAGEGSRIHDKYFIFDRKRVWTGSANLTTADFAANHNHALVVNAPAVAALYQHDFDELWAGRFGTAKRPSPATQATVNGHALEVYFSPQDGALDQVIAAVNTAQATIDFAILQLRDDALAEALAAAQARGVRVRGLMDAGSADDGESDDEALCAAGVALRVEATPGRMHHKLMVIDALRPPAEGAGPRAVAGSLNWTEPGRTVSSENTLILHEPALVAAFAAEFETMWAQMPPAAECNVLTGGEAAARLYLPLVRRGF
jgi:phosphatidylserine/phosphatidylglycerophosphate/cardiolipin synthase-like enzyme